MKICMHLTNFTAVKFKTPFQSTPRKFMTVTKINCILVIVFNYAQGLDSRCLATICSNLAGEFVLVLNRQLNALIVRYSPKIFKNLGFFVSIFTNLTFFSKKTVRRIGEMFF